MSTLSASSTGVKYNPKQLEIKTLSVEKLLEPLVIQVTTLVNNKISNKKKGKSKKPKELVKSVEDATEAFIAKGNEIARENPGLRTELEKAVEQTHADGEVMAQTSHSFADDPLSPMKRGSMVRAARALLSSVTKLLILADIADVMRLLSKLKLLKRSAADVRDASDFNRLEDAYENLMTKMHELQPCLLNRQNDLKDPKNRDDLAAARAELLTNGKLLYDAVKLSIHHPDVAGPNANKDAIYKRLIGTMDKVNSAVQGNSSGKKDSSNGELEQAMEDLLNRVNMDPLSFEERKHRPSLEERLESIISGAALMADSSCTREERRERIVAECNAVRQALQDLLNEYMSAQAEGRPTDDLENAIDYMQVKTKDLRRQLQKAVIDHISDTLLDTSSPIMALISAAQSGDENLVKEEAQIFRDHANKLVEVANLACSVSGNQEGNRMVKLAAKTLEVLCPQVINSALTLAARPESEPAQKNMDSYKDTWLKHVGLLTDAVDEITPIDKFLAISENHILEDITKCVQAIQEDSQDDLLNSGNDILGRSARVVHVVRGEMENYEPDFYVQKVTDACDALENAANVQFSEQLDKSANAIASGDKGEAFDNEFIDSSRMVYDAVREVRQAVLALKDPEELETDSDDPDGDNMSRVSGRTNDTIDRSKPDEREKMKKAIDAMNEEQRKEFETRQQELKEEREVADQELGKWDETSNDIIVLARQMCAVMLDMTNFTRGRGKLKNTSDVIEASKKIANIGSRLDNIARGIADMCPESSVKDDLLAYLERISLYCHQLKMCAKVKAEVQNISGEMVVSGVEGAMSLIQAAKNLMNSVVLTVKTSYVASTKFDRAGNNKGNEIQWKMKVPDKKPLVRSANQKPDRPVLRRASQKKISHGEALSEFKHDM